MNFFESDLAFRQHVDEPIYDCRENCEMAIYRSTDIDEVNVWLKKLSENGFLAIRKNEIDGNRFAMFEKDGLHITSYYTPCDSSLRVTVGENPVFYPPASIMEKTQVFLTLPAETNKLMDDLWIKLKSK